MKEYLKIAAVALIAVAAANRIPQVRAIIAG